MTPLRVLIIDDDMDLRQALSATLEEEDNWEIQDRGFGNTAEVLERIRPDMVVLDLIEGQGADGRATGNDSFGEHQAEMVLSRGGLLSVPGAAGFQSSFGCDCYKGRRYGAGR